MCIKILLLSSFSLQDTFTVHSIPWMLEKPACSQTLQLEISHHDHMTFRFVCASGQKGIGLKIAAAKASAWTQDYFECEISQIQIREGLWFYGHSVMTFFFYHISYMRENKEKHNSSFNRSLRTILSSSFCLNGYIGALTSTSRLLWWYGK